MCCSFLRGGAEARAGNPRRPRRLTALKVSPEVIYLHGILVRNFILIPVRSINSCERIRTVKVVFCRRSVLKRPPVAETGRRRCASLTSSSNVEAWRQICKQKPRRNFNSLILASFLSWDFLQSPRVFVVSSLKCSSFLSTYTSVRGYR